jgi:colanic acid/amylovoran biosynthesis glycosyltransferase
MKEKAVSNDLNLVLLTEHYPFGDQEAFLENEVIILSKRFHEIHIYSFAALDERQTRSVPENVMVKKVRKGSRMHLSDALLLLTKSGIEDIAFVTREYKYKIRHTVSSLICRYSVAKRCFLPYLLKENPHNTIFYSYWFSHLSYALACYKRKNPKSLCVTRAHRFDNFIDYNSCFMREYIINNMDAIFPISQKGKREIIEKMLAFFPNENIATSVHYLGVQIADIVNPASADGITRIVSCSNIIPIKRLDLIIQTLSKITMRKIEWIHFGGGRDAEEIMAYAKDLLGHMENIDYTFMGPVPHEYIIEYYRSNHVDVMINASDHEGIPVSVMEAMAAGIICIARDVGGNSELIINGETGILLPENVNAEDISEQIVRILDMDAAEKNRIKLNAIKKVHTDFNTDSAYDLFIDEIYDLFLKKTKAPDK